MTSIVKMRKICIVIFWPEGYYELKETQEGMDSMCEEMDKIYQEGISDW